MKNVFIILCAFAFSVSSCLHLEVEIEPGPPVPEVPAGSDDTLLVAVNEAPGFSGHLPVGDIAIDAQGWAWLGWDAISDESQKGLVGIHLEEKIWSSHAFPAPYENSLAEEVEVAGDGRIFCRPDFLSDQLFAFTPSGWETFSFSNLNTFDAARDSEEVWVLDAVGLHRIKGDELTLFELEQLPTDTAIVALSAISGGGVWALTAASDLIRYDGSDWQQFELKISDNNFEAPAIASASDGSVYIIDVPAFVRIGADGAVLQNYAGDMLQEGWLIRDVYVLPQSGNLILGGYQFFVHYDQQTNAYTYFDYETAALDSPGNRFFADTDEAGTVWVAGGGVIAALPEHLR